MERPDDMHADTVAADNRGAAPNGWMAATWDKYGLIVVGNIIFFALLYLFSYRPHNATARANEYLQIAQQQESEGRYEAAEVLYRTVTSRYGDTDAAALAGARLPTVQRLHADVRSAAEKPNLPPDLTLEKIVAGPPAWFVARMLARRYEELADNDRQPFLAALDGYMRLAFARGEIDFPTASKHHAFRHDTLQRRYFDLRSKCGFHKDLVYDDIYVRNDNHFAWHDVVIDVFARQGDRVEKATVRAEKLAPGAKIEAVELRIKDDGGAVSCSIVVRAKEGELRAEQSL